MKFATDKPGMNLVQTRGQISEDGVVSIPKTFSLMGSKTLRINFGAGVDGHFVPAAELLEWEIDALRQGIVGHGVLYLRNFGTSGMELQAGDPLGKFTANVSLVAGQQKKKAGRPKGSKTKKKAATRAA